MKVVAQSLPAFHQLPEEDFSKGTIVAEFTCQLFEFRIIPRAPHRVMLTSTRDKCRGYFMQF